MDKYKGTVIVDFSNPLKVAAFLDMLRYDAAIVTDWGSGGIDPNSFSVNIMSRHPISSYRWASFGIFCKEDY